MLTYQGISSNAKILLCWLVFSADVRDGAVRSVTQAEMAREFGWSPQTTRRSLDELVDAGMIVADLPRGRHRGGWIQILAYYDVMQPTRWLSRQRAIGGS